VEEWRSGGVEEWRSGGVEEWRSDLGEEKEYGMLSSLCLSLCAEQAAMQGPCSVLHAWVVL